MQPFYSRNTAFTRPSISPLRMQRSNRPFDPLPQSSLAEELNKSERSYQASIKEEINIQNLMRKEFNRLKGVEEYSPDLSNYKTQKKPIQGTKPSWGKTEMPIKPSWTKNSPKKPNWSKTEFSSKAESNLKHLLRNLKLKSKTATDRSIFPRPLTPNRSLPLRPETGGPVEAL